MIKLDRCFFILLLVTGLTAPVAIFFSVSQVHAAKDDAGRENGNRSCAQKFKTLMRTWLPGESKSGAPAQSTLTSPGGPKSVVTFEEATSRPISVNQMPPQISTHVTAQIPASKLAGIADRVKINWGVAGESKFDAKKKERVRAVAETVKKFLAHADQMGRGADEKRIASLFALMKNRTLFPKNAVIHIVGPSNSSEEWVLPLLAASDTKIVLFEVDAQLQMLSTALKDDSRLERIWDGITKNYGIVLSGSSIRTFDDFKKQVRSRVSLNDGFHNSTYIDSPFVIPPAGGVKAVPRADMIILNQPHLRGADGKALSGLFVPATNVLQMILRQLKTDSGLVWVNTEDLSHRMGVEFEYLPHISMPRERTSFEAGEDISETAYGAGLPLSLIDQSVLIVP